MALAKASRWTPDGHVSEGSGMNIFLVHDNTLYTPPLAASILPGITRDSIVKLAGDLNIPVKESVIPREMLYIADEVFFVGTAVEVTPIRSVDKIIIGKGSAGPVTLRRFRKSSSRSPAAKSRSPQLADAGQRAGGGFGNPTATVQAIVIPQLRDLNLNVGRKSVSWLHSREADSVNR